MIQTLTKSLGILALILTFALTASAQKKKLDTDLANGCYSLPCPQQKITTWVEYHASTRRLTITPNDNITFKSVFVASIGTTGNVKTLKTSYSRNQAYSKTMSSLGITSGTHRIIVIDENNKVLYMNFFVN